MRALVTGGAGFIGSNLVDALLAVGAEVSVIDNLSTGREANLHQAIEHGARLRVIDILDPDDVNRAFDEDQPEVVFHLAAQIDVRKSLVRPAWDAEINVMGTINVLEAARRIEGIRVVDTSTGGAIYGAADVIPTPETAETRPEAAYGQSKLSAEGYCALYTRLYGLSTVILRYGNVYGPRQDPLGEAGVVAMFCGRLMLGKRPTVYGDGLQTRDYVYVGDVVEANLAAAARTDAGGPINIGTGRPSTVLDLVEAMAELSGTADFSPVFEPPRFGELMHSCLDVSRAREMLGWEASTEFLDGLRRTMAATLPAPKP
ncbi:MAG: NAD-dependent epimerase/dehydratase family protein [Actinobacteria bacterium]|nr:NAD-dependent epimerase/dehydratase family protein [Actinomycetota bacterium]